MTESQFTQILRIYGIDETLEKLVLYIDDVAPNLLDDWYNDIMEAQ